MKGKIVKQILKDNGFELTEVADKIGISPQLLQSWLSVNEVKLSKLTMISKAINKTLNFFYSNVETMDMPAVMELGASYGCPECKAKDMEIELLRERITELKDFIEYLKKQKSG